MDWVITDLAGRQHGVVARAQLVGMGIGQGAIDHRLDRGRVHLVHRGVYAVGHPVLGREGRWMAAVLAAGPGAVLSHRAAGALWGVRPSGRMEVTAPRRRRLGRGTTVHRSALAAEEMTTVTAIPVTTVPRTLFDLASVLGPRHVERAIHEAEFRRLPDPLSLSDLVERYPRRRGVAAIKAILAEARPVAVTRSELEDRFLAFLAGAVLPLPEVNARLFVGGRWLECDCVWRAQRLVVELDGRAAHGTADAFERDRERDRMLHAESWLVVRITWRQLLNDPDAIAADLRALLRRHAGS